MLLKNKKFIKEMRKLFKMINKKNQKLKKKNIQKIIFIKKMMTRKKMIKLIDIKVLQKKNMKFNQLVFLNQQDNIEQIMQKEKDLHLLYHFILLKIILKN